MELMTIKALYLNTHFPMSFQLQSKHSKSTVLLSIHFMWPDRSLFEAVIFNI